MSVRQTVLIDLDDTIYDAEAGYEYALQAVGIDSASELFLAAKATVKSRLPEGHVCARNRALYFKRYLELQKQFSAPKLYALLASYEKHLAQHIDEQCKKLRRDDFLRELSQKYRLALITNENLRTQIAKINVVDPTGKFFERVVVSEEMGEEKPSYKMFTPLIQEWNLNAQDCWMVGDNFAFDIVPAAQLGLKTIWTTEFRKGAPSTELPARCTAIQHLTELPRILG